MEKNCWTCGHYLIGGMCFKKGVNEPYDNTSHDYVCSDWVKENSEGTITGMISDNVKEIVKQEIK